MGDDAGRALLGLLRGQAFALLHEARRALDDAHLLDPLGQAGPEWAGTALEGHLLDPIGGDGVGGALAQRVLSGLHELAAVATPTVAAGLHGWDPAAGAAVAPRGIAWALRAGTPGSSLAAALVVTLAGDGSPRLALVASGATTGAMPIDLGGGWTLQVDGRFQGRLELSWSPAGAPEIVSPLDDADALHVELHRPAPAAAPTGPGIDLGELVLGGALTVAGGTPVPSATLRISRGSVRLDPGGLGALLPALQPIPLDVALTADAAHGVALAGSPTLRVRLPTSGSLPGVSVGPLDVTLTPGAGPDGVHVGVDVRTNVLVELPAVPIRLDLRGLGLGLPFSLGDAAAKLGFDPSELTLPDPTGAGVDVDLPIVRAGGLVDKRGSDYAGLLSAEIPPMAVSAFGVLSTGDPVSFLVVMSAAFPPPGIQIGFGFSISAVGGIVGVNRRIDRDALTRAVGDGTLAGVLFPTDLAAQADRVIDALPALFPQSDGRVVVGPMFQIAWGGELLRASAALIVELPDPVRFSLLGKIELAIPHPAIPLLHLEATFAGQIDPSVPSLEFRASLTRSNLAGMALTGDVYLLTRGGDDAAFALSAGGFHPAYRAPSGVPALQRLGIDLSPSPLIDLRCEAYVAITSNTAQFGARVDLVAEIAGCGLRGHLGFDVLIELDPLHFVADVSAGIAVTFLGETLVAVSLDLALEGPAPWRARGRGSIDLFLFSASFDFDETWGDRPPASLPPPSIEPALTAALADRAAWTLQPPDLSGAVVQFTPAAARELAAGDRLHPQGSLGVLQRVVPLAIALGRFGGAPLSAPERWDLTAPTLAGQAVTTAGERREQFAAGQYLELTDEQALGRPGFESFRAGIEMTPGAVTPDVARETNVDYDTKVIGPQATQAAPGLTAVEAAAAMILAAAGSIDHPLWWQAPAERVVVRDAPAPAVADTWSLAPVDASADTVAGAADALAAMQAGDPGHRLGVVEAWELAA